MSFKFISGEIDSVKEQLITSSLKTMILQDFFNADEFGLFYHCFSSKSLHLKNKNCIGGKLNMVRLTGMATGNVKGERLPIFVVGRQRLQDVSEV